MTRFVFLLFIGLVGQLSLCAQFCSDVRHLDVGHLVKVPKATKSNPNKVISIYLETDRHTRNQLGSDAATEQWLRDVYMEMAKLYANDGISTALTDTYFPPNNAQDWSSSFINGSIITLLEEFGELRQDTPNGRLKHFVSLDGARLGVAWVDVLQSNYFTFTDNNGVLHHAGPYGINLGLDIAQSTWNKILLAHEAGHNIGSPHTHRCVWGNGSQLIDDCSGVEGVSSTNDCSNASFSVNAEENTIMSYCDDNLSLINGFGVEPGNLLRSKVNNASIDLMGGNCAIIMYLASNVEGNYYASEDVVFRPGMDSDGMCVFIGCP